MKMSMELAKLPSHGEKLKTNRANQMRTYSISRI